MDGVSTGTCQIYLFLLFLYNDTGSCQTKTTGRVEHRLELLLWPLSTETPLCCVK